MLYSLLPSYHKFLNKPLELIHNKHFPHAFMLNSQDGLPSLLIAKILSQALLCSENTLVPCGKCNSCILVDKNNHPDLLYSFPYISKGQSTTCDDYISEWHSFLDNHPIFLANQWSDALDGGNKQFKIFTAESERIQKFQSLKPYTSKKKVIILYQSELLHNSTANKLLKSIEEPLENTHLILITHDFENTLPTITSRCQSINIPQLTNSNIQEELKALNLELDNAAISISHGNIGLYQYILTNKRELDHEGNQFLQWLRDCFKANTRSLIAYSEELSKSGREQLISILESHLQYFRDAFINPDNSQIPASVLLSMQKLSSFITDKNASIIYDHIHKLLFDIKRNANPKIAILDTSIKISASIKI